MMRINHSLTKSIPHVRIVTNCTLASDTVDTIDINFDEHASPQHIEDTFFNLVIELYQKHCINEGEISLYQLSFLNFSQPDVYVDGIPIILHPHCPPDMQYLHDIVANVNLRRKQWSLNKQSSVYNFPIDRAVRDSDEWVRCGGSPKAPKPLTYAERSKMQLDGKKEWDEMPLYKKILGIFNY